MSKYVKVEHRSENGQEVWYVEHVLRPELVGGQAGSQPYATQAEADTAAELIESHITRNPNL